MNCYTAKRSIMEGFKTSFALTQCFLDPLALSDVCVILYTATGIYPRQYGLAPMLKPTVFPFAVRDYMALKVLDIGIIIVGGKYFFGKVYRIFKDIFDLPPDELPLIFPNSILLLQTKVALHCTIYPDDREISYGNNKRLDFNRE